MSRTTLTERLPLDVGNIDPKDMESEDTSPIEKHLFQPSLRERKLVRMFRQLGEVDLTLATKTIAVLLEDASGLIVVRVRNHENSDVEPVSPSGRTGRFYFVNVKPNPDVEGSAALQTEVGTHGKTLATVKDSDVTVVLTP